MFKSSPFIVQVKKKETHPWTGQGYTIDEEEGKT